MHIKQVIISGFRSFRSQGGEIEEFSPHHNVIVGRNGSGKSNFFDAIQFVLLAPKFASLRQEDRQNLLHEGAGSSVMAAYVEIIFDNTDGRLSVDSEEVILRRTVGLKKDEFFLNRKHITKSEVLSLLESAGFSKSNPYYIVQQGKVANLCVMKDEDRLNLLKEVAGTTVYEERRRESIAIMKETSTKQEKIEEVLDFIDERLEELDEEKKELAYYDTLDKRRRALEYNLYDKEYQHAQESLQQIEQDHEAQREQQHTYYTQLHTLQDQITQEEESMTSYHTLIERYSSREHIKQDQLNQLISQEEKYLTEIQLLEANIQESNRMKQDNEVLLQSILQSIQHHEEKLTELQPVYTTHTEELIQLRQELQQSHKRLEELYGKQGRSKQFTSIQERNMFLTQQITQLQQTLQSKQQMLSTQQQEQQTMNTFLQEEKQLLTQLEQANQIRLQTYQQLNTSIQQVTNQRNQQQEIRKNHWQELELLSEQKQDISQELERYKDQLNRTLPRYISEGLAIVEHIVQDQKIVGYYGPIIDNIRLKDDAFRTPIEVVGGNALFSVIVKDDQIAAKLILELEKHKIGRLTFLPLNRLRVKQYKYPESNEVKPLTSVALEYSPTIEVAIQSVFGGRLLARDIEVGSQFSRDYGFDCITMEGDYISAKGSFEGGYRDERFSRILAVHKIRESTKKLTLLQQQEQQLHTSTKQLEQQINDYMNHLSQLQIEKNQLKLLYDEELKDIMTRQRQLTTIQKNTHQITTILQSIHEEIHSLTVQIQSYQHELTLPLIIHLTNEERNELQSLEQSLPMKKTLYEEKQMKLNQINDQLDGLRVELENVLYKRKEELMLSLVQHSNGPSSATSSAGISSSAAIENELEPFPNTSSHDYQSELFTYQTQLAIIQQNKQKYLHELQEITQQLTETQQHYKHIEQQLDLKKTQESLINEQLTNITHSFDKYLHKRSLYLETIQVKQRAIRDLGSVPRQEIEETKLYIEKQIIQELKTINQQLSSYSNVNRKALDQYISFHEQKESLLQRKEEMNRDTKAIETLIQSLDAQKDEAILRTFQGVSKHFTQVFQELVPHGMGKLIMKTMLDDQENMMELEETIPVSSTQVTTTSERRSSRAKKSTSTPSNFQLPDVNTFKGIQVQVSFTDTRKMYQMQELSGGQKSLVALALIFAIQRCDPAPFYLFDEIDQALDEKYRQSVAQLIARQAMSQEAPAQFITTTFRPELVNVADKWFGIKLENKVSNLVHMNKSIALRFVNDLLQEDEAVGEANYPSYRRTTPSRPRVEDDVSIEGGGLSRDNDEGDDEEEDLRRKPRPSRFSRSVEQDFNDDEEELDPDGSPRIEIRPEDEEAFRKLGLSDRKK